jgi:hypothetical protein
VTPEPRGGAKVGLSLSQTSSSWQLIENQANLLWDEGSLQAHWLDGGEIPYATEQGISSAEQGILVQEQGIFLVKSEIITG